MKKALVFFLAMLFTFSPMLSLEASAEQNLFSVEFTVPADFVDSGTTQETLDAQADENGWKSAALNEDGSATYVMSKAKHNELMAKLKQSYEDSLPDLINTGDYPNFVSVTANDDFTEFEIITKAESLNFTETFSVLGFYMVGGLYNCYNGTPGKNVNVRYINEGSGAVVEEYNSGNMDTANTEPEAISGAVSTEADLNTASYNMSETVIIDDANCVFKVTEVIPDDPWGFTLKVLLENKSDRNLMFSWENVSILGYSIDPFWAEEVTAGKKAVSEISFSRADLEQCGIGSVDEIIFDLLVYDMEDWLAERLVDDTFAIYPTGLSSETVVYPQRQVVEGEKVIVDNEFCTFIIQSVNLDDMWGYTLECFVENKTGHEMLFLWDGVSVNGYMCDPYWGEIVAPEKRSYSEISFSDSELEKCGIEAVTDIEFTFSATDNGSYSTLYSEVFTYNP